MPQDPSSGGYSPLDRPPTLPPEVTPSTFNQLAGQQDPNAGNVTAGDMQVKGVVAQLGMNAEILITKLGQLTPGSESIVAQIVSMIRQLAVSALTGPSMGAGPQGMPQAPPEGTSPMGSLAGGGSQGPPPQIPMGMGGGY